MLDHEANYILSHLLKHLFFTFVVTDNVGESIENCCNDFTYLHDIKSAKIDSRLTDDFEPYGFEKYCLSIKGEMFINVTLHYEDGSISDADYDVEDFNKIIFEELISYSLKRIGEEIKQKICNH